MAEDFIDISEKNDGMSLEKKRKYYKNAIWLLKSCIIIGMIEGSYFAYDFLLKTLGTEKSVLNFLYEKSGGFLVISIVFKLILHVFHAFYPKLAVTSDFIRGLKNPDSYVKNMNSEEECIFFSKLLFILFLH